MENKETYNRLVERKDEYSRDLKTFYQHAMTHGYVSEFLELLEKAESQNKKVILTIPDDVLWDDILLTDLSISQESQSQA